METQRNGLHFTQPTDTYFTQQIDHLTYLHVIQQIYLTQWHTLPNRHTLPNGLTHFTQQTQWLDKLYPTNPSEKLHQQEKKLKKHHQRSNRHKPIKWKSLATFAKFEGKK